jgi:hypothetical protein
LILDGCLTDKWSMKYPHGSERPSANPYVM